MRSVHAAWFAGMLCCYDLVATGLTSVMDRFAAQVMGLLFAPLPAVTQGRPPVALGLGDLLLLALFPPVALKAFGRAAALLAAEVGLAVSASVSLLFGLGVLTGAFPLLTALGPLIVLQHVLWSWSRSGERTTAEWRAGTPRAGAADTLKDPDPALLLALEPTGVDALGAELSGGDWPAVADGRVVGSGKSPGQARRDARLRGCESVPVVHQNWSGLRAGATTGEAGAGCAVPAEPESRHGTTAYGSRQTGRVPASGARLFAQPGVTAPIRRRHRPGRVRSVSRAAWRSGPAGRARGTGR